MEISTVNPKNFWFESSLTEETCNGLTELGLLERRTEKFGATQPFFLGRFNIYLFVYVCHRDLILRYIPIFKEKKNLPKLLDSLNVKSPRK